MPRGQSAPPPKPDKPNPGCLGFLIPAYFRKAVGASPQVTATPASANQRQAT